ncbi:MAG TPA: hypothetical protein VNV63_04770 [Nitrospiria bacterium]|nr:hypothetical protein [Nitrospiria bacterium]
MMVLDHDVAELLSHTCHPDRALDCVNDVSDGGPKSVTTLGALKQRSDQFIHPLDGPTDFLVKFVPFCFADMRLGEKFCIRQDGGQRKAKIVAKEGHHLAYVGLRLRTWNISLHAL